MKMKKRTYYLSPTHDAMVKKMKEKMYKSESEAVRVAIEWLFDYQKIAEM